jgi:hypothetical protein
VLLLKSLWTKTLAPVPFRQDYAPVAVLRQDYASVAMFRQEYASVAVCNQ